MVMGKERDRLVINVLNWAKADITNVTEDLAKLDWEHLLPYMSVGTIQRRNSMFKANMILEEQNRKDYTCGDLWMSRAG